MTKLLPAIRGKMGTWVYYVSNLSFKDISEYVKKIDSELHTSKVLNQLIQRNITENYKNIKKYIEQHNDRFFNSLVLAVYDGEPEWIEVEMSFEEHEFHNMGFLKLSGSERIFPVDGQHRVEGIKSALIENSKLNNETISVIFIGHKNDKEGMERSRRLFTHLNRYAKPVSIRDIIALDEDDIVAISTRYLLENCNLFKDARILDSKGRPLPENNKTALTTIITLYDCNRKLLTTFLKIKGIKTEINQFLKIRPEDPLVDEYNDYCIDFWNDFSKSMLVVHDFLSLVDSPAEKYRSKDIGGNLLFRPAGLLPFIDAINSIKQETKNDFNSILQKFNKMNFNIDSTPWNKILWNSVEKTMITGNNTLIKLILKFKFNKEILTNKELHVLNQKLESKNLNINDLEKI